PPPADNPPVARLTVTNASSPAMTVNADGSSSTDADATPIASYRFDFGDGSAAVTTTAPNATTSHTYASAGTYTVTLIATDTGGHASSPATASVTVSAPPPPGTGSIAVYGGYYDTHHTVNPKPKPSPWKGSANVVFDGLPDRGSTNGWDTSTIRVDNLGAAAITVSITVDIGTHHYALWGSHSVPAGASVIFAQTSVENFDGSDTNPAGCYGCSPSECTSMVSQTIPVVHVTVNGVTTSYEDPGQVLNTNGVDAAGCPATGTRNDESHPWVELHPGSGGAQATAWHAQVPAFDTQGSLGPPVPNPTHGDLEIRFTTRTRGQVHVGLYDLAGREVVRCVDDVLDPGDYDMRLSLADKPPGMYVLRLVTPAGMKNRRITYVR
ncbi:MAG: PKD domain-containing protein, partial [Planctomycetaceae bacterium]